jgi:DNA polymerase-3 subunit delta
MTRTETDSKKKRELIYVIAGKEASLVNAECEKLLDRLIEPHQRPLGLFNPDPAEVSLHEIFDELRTAPFLTEKRVVLIKDADDFVSENRSLLENYFDNPSPTGILVLTVASWSSSTKLAKALSNVGTLLTVTQPKPSQLPDRLIRYAADVYAKSLSRDAAELLIELTGDDLTRLYTEIDKLAIFVDTEKTVTPQNVEVLIGHNRLFNVFAVIDAVIAGDSAKAVARLRNMFAEDKSSEFTVVGAFAFHFRRMFNAKVLLEQGVRPAEIAAKLRIWSSRDSFFLQLRKMSLQQIGSNLQQLAEMDYEIKTGRTKAAIAIEQFILKLISASDANQCIP